MDLVFLIAATLAAALGILAAAAARNLVRRERVLACAGLLIAYVLAIWLWPAGWVLRDLLGISVAGIAGAMLGGLLRDRSTLLAFLITASIVDAVSVAMGPSRALISQETPIQRLLLSALTVILPFGGRTFALVGLPDIVGVAGIYAALRLEGYRALGSAIAPLASLAVAVAVALLWRPLPAYPFIAVGVFLFVTTRRSSRDARSV